MTSAVELARRLAPEIVSIEAADLEAHGIDMSATALLAKRRGSFSRPEVVVRARSVAEVSDLLRAAQSAAVPVVPWGGGSGVCGGIAADGGIVLDLRPMNRVIEIDEESQTVSVEAGISGPEIVAALTERGYTLGHEPQSLEVSTVGGWIATRACGQLSSRYGGIEDVLVSLDAVLPDGRIVSGRPSPRRSTGPEVADLMIGSEGTLGVVTGAVLRIRKMGRERIDSCFRFPQMADGIDAARALAQSDLRPTLLRLYDPDDAALFWRAFPEPPQGAVLLLSFDGSFPRERSGAAGELVRGEPLDLKVAAHWWAHRNDAVNDYLRLMSGVSLLGPHAMVDTMEISATWRRLPEIYDDLKRTLAAAADVAACHLSHVYPDGACLYFVLASACADDATAEKTHGRWWELGMSGAVELGASISHHHGVGRLKAPWLPQELGGWWEVLRALKREVDPKGIMNPGALGL